MPLTTKLVPLAIGGVGLDTGADPKVTDQGLLRAENIVWKRRGAACARNGVQLITGAHTETFMARYKDRPVLIQHALKTLDGVAGGYTFAQADTLALWSVEPTRTPTPQGARRYNGCVLESGHVRAWAWVEEDPVGATYDLHLATYERYSGRLLDELTVVTPAYLNTQPRLVFDDDTIYYLYVFGNSLWIGEIDRWSGAIYAPVDTLQAMDQDAPMDACAIGNHWICAVSRSVAAVTLVVAMLDVDHDLYASQIFPGLAANGQVAVCQRQVGEAFVAFGDTSVPQQIWVGGFDTTPAPTIGGASVRTLAGGVSVMNLAVICPSAAAAEVYATEDDAALQPRVIKIDCDLPALAAVTPTALIRKSTVASRPWRSSSNTFLWVTYDEQRYSFIIGSGGRICGSVFRGLIEGSGRATPLASGYVASTEEDGTVWRTALRQYVDAATHGPAVVEARRPTALHCLEAADALLIPNSLPLMFDGAAVGELGYAHVPERPVGTAAGAGGALSAGKYSLIVSYQRRDNNGRLWEISSVPAAEVTAVLNDQITWTIPYLNHTLWPDVEVVLYRTVANGSKFYERARLANNVQLDRYAGGYVDGAADATITGNAEHYTSGGVQMNSPPPAIEVQAIHQNRIVAADAESPGTRMWYSKQIQPGVGVEFAGVLVADVPPDGGDITALASLADKLVTFKADRAWAFTGSGLSALGSGTGYLGPYLVSEVVGCINQRSVALTPGGLMFAASDRIYSLSAQMAVKPDGDPVRYYTDALDGLGRTIVAAVNLPERHMVVWLTGNEALSYDYLYGLWSTWTGHEATDGCEAGGLLWHHKSSGGGRVWVEDRASWDDEGWPVAIAMETGTISLAGLAGYKRLKRLLLVGHNITNHTLHVEIAYDHDAYWEDAVAYDSVGLAYHGYATHLGTMAVGALADQAYLLEVSPSRERCTSFRLRIYTTQKVVGQGVEILGVGAVVALLDGVGRVGPDRRMA